MHKKPGAFFLFNGCKFTMETYGTYLKGVSVDDGLRDRQEEITTLRLSEQWIDVDRRVVTYELPRSADLMWGFSVTGPRVVRWDFQFGHSVHVAPTCFATERQALTLLNQPTGPGVSLWIQVRSDEEGGVDDVGGGDDVTVSYHTANLVDAVARARVASTKIMFSGTRAGAPFIGYVQGGGEGDEAVAVVYRGDTSPLPKTDVARLYADAHFLAHKYVDWRKTQTRRMRIVRAGPGAEFDFPRPARGEVVWGIRVDVADGRWVRLRIGNNPIKARFPGGQCPWFTTRNCPCLAFLLRWHIVRLEIEDGDGPVTVTYHTARLKPEYVDVMLRQTVTQGLDGGDLRITYAGGLGTIDDRQEA